MTDEYFPSATGARISDLRDSAGLTIEELAAKIGINATTLGRMEKGQTKKVSNNATASPMGMSIPFKKQRHTSI